MKILTFRNFVVFFADDEFRLMDGGVLLLQFFCCQMLAIVCAEKTRARSCQMVDDRVQWPSLMELKSLNIVLVLFLLVAFIVSIARTVLDCVRDKKLVAISVLRMPGCLCGVRSQLNLVGLSVLWLLSSSLIFWYFFYVCCS